MNQIYDYREINDGGVLLMFGGGIAIRHLERDSAWVIRRCAIEFFFLVFSICHLI